MITEFNRRGFMAAILSSCAAPAIIKAQSLMPIWIPSTQVVLPKAEIEIYGPEWLDALRGTRMSGGSYLDIIDGKCIANTGRDGVVVMGYRFPKDLQ